MGCRLQWGAPALLAEIPDTRGLRRHIHRNGRSAAQPRPAPPFARCSTRATRRTKPRDSNCCWMNVRWQVSAPPIGPGEVSISGVAGLTVSSGTCATKPQIALARCSILALQVRHRVQRPTPTGGLLTYSLPPDERVGDVALASQHTPSVATRSAERPRVVQELFKRCSRVVGEA